ncbi:hypothetical protein B0H19DRAFT_1252482 [Mycena capillaripes]|nr:hypothetical protein B0H19DRAFT_1252482 [Mycena capillaripes]
MATQASPSVGNVGPIFVDIFGPVFWGFCVSLVLSGLTILQGYLYFTRYNDKLLIRGVAGLMLVLDLLSTALVCQSIYYYILPDYGSLAPLGAVTGELDVDCLISSVIAFMSVNSMAHMFKRNSPHSSQMYFVYQAKAAPIMNAAIVILGTISFGGGIELVPFQRVFAGIHKASGAAADVVATIAMLIFLKAADTGIRQTSSILRSLMYLVVNRGLLVTAAQVVTLIVLFASTSHLYWVAVHINTTRLYVNTFFAMLNARTTSEENHGLHISMGGVSGTRQTGSSFHVTKFPESATINHDSGGDLKLHTTSTVSDI